MEKETKRIEIIASGELLQYDSTKVYDQLGKIVQANKTIREAMGLLATLTRSMTDETAIVITGLSNRIDEAASNLLEIEKLIVNGRSRGEDQKVIYITRISELSKMTLQWMKTFILDHNVEDREELIPILNLATQLTAKIGALTAKKIQTAVAMEDAHDRVRSRHRHELTETSVAIDDKEDPESIVFETPITSFQEMVNAIRKEILAKEKAANR